MQSSTSTLSTAVETNGAMPTTSTCPFPPPPPSSTHRFSAEAAPFVPSYMCTQVLPAAVAPVEPAPLKASRAASEGDDEVGVDKEDTSREHFSKMWMYCLQQMQGHEVGMLMDMMPPDIQELYSEKLSDEYLLHEDEHKDKSVRALCAAQTMLQELTPEQLARIETFLVETDALNPEVKQRRGRTRHLPGDGELNEENDSGDGDAGDDGEDLFMHHDEGMGSDEEEWLLEQMMAVGDKTDAAAT